MIGKGIFVWSFWAASGRMTAHLEAGLPPEIDFSLALVQADE
jgi:hypothetical protein